MTYTRSRREAYPNKKDPGRSEAVSLSVPRGSAQTEARTDRAEDRGEDVEGAPHRVESCGGVCPWVQQRRRSRSLHLRTPQLLLPHVEDARRKLGADM